MTESVLQETTERILQGVPRDIVEILPNKAEGRGGDVTLFDEG